MLKNIDEKEKLSLNAEIKKRESMNEEELEKRINTSKLFNKDQENKVKILHESLENLRKIKKLKVITKKPETWENLTGLIIDSSEKIRKFIDYTAQKHPILNEMPNKSEDLRLYMQFYNALIRDYTQKQFFPNDIEVIETSNILNKYGEWFFNRGSLVWDIWDIEPYKTFEEFESLVSEFLCSSFLVFAFKYHPNLKRGEFISLEGKYREFKKFKEEVLSKKYKSIEELLIRANNSLDAFTNSSSIDPLSFLFTNKLSLVSNLIKKFKNNTTPKGVYDCIEEYVKMMDSFYKKGQINHLQLYEKDVEMLKLILGEEGYTTLPELKQKC